MEQKEKERKSKKKKRRKEKQIQGMETNLDYGFYDIWFGSLVLYDYYLAQT